MPDDLKAENNATEISIGKLTPSQEKTVNWKVYIKTDKPKESYTIKIKVLAKDCETKILSKEVKVETKLLKKAILVVPGIMGSNLADKKTGELYWNNEALGNAYELWQLGKFNCDENGKSINPDIIPLSGPYEYGALDTYKELVVQLKRTYATGNNVFVEFVPYDWRLGLDECAETLAKTIAQYDTVTIVAHSMGGLVTEKYLEKHGTDKIVKVITAGTPYWGSTMAFNSLVSGNVEVFPGLVSGVMELKMYKILRNIEGIHALLLNEHYSNKRDWLSVGEYTYEDAFWKTGGEGLWHSTRNWEGTKGQYERLFNHNVLEPALEDISEISPTSSSCMIDKVDNTIIVGFNQPTKTYSTYTEYTNGLKPITKPKNAILQTQPTYEGDSTVPFLSATMGQVNTSDLNGILPQKIGRFVIMDGYKHVQLVESKFGTFVILSLLTPYYEADTKYMISYYKDSVQKELDDEKKTSNYGEIVEKELNEEQNRSIMPEMTMLAAEEDSTQKADTNNVLRQDEFYEVLLAADSQIDVYQDDELVAFMHNDQVKDNDNIMFDFAGYYDDKPVYQVTLVQGDYDVKIMSNTTQEVKCFFKRGETIHSIESLNCNDKDMLCIKVSEAEIPVFTYNTKKISPVVVVNGVVQKPEDMIEKSDIIVSSMNVKSLPKINDTIDARIKIENHGEKPIRLNELEIVYPFSGDGNSNFCFELDWAAIDHTKVITSMDGIFTKNGNEDSLTMSFKNNEQSIQPGKEFEIHLRIHTPDWKKFNITNSSSFIHSDIFVDNPTISINYLGYLVE